MKTLPDTTLPSNPGITVRLREASVEDAIDFADVYEGMEESATTLFLERVQDKVTYTDPKTWTGEDRRLALFWYWIHLTEDPRPALTFMCAVCGEEHTVAVDLRPIADEYKPIQGKPERDVDFDGSTVVIRPLTGANLEEIEMMRLKLDDAIEKDGPKSGRVKRLRCQLDLLQFMLQIEFQEEESEKSPREYREKKLLNMGYSEFTDFANKVSGVAAELVHGLPCQIEDGRMFLETPEVPCTKPENNGRGGTQVLIPFRNIDYIPRI